MVEECKVYLFCQNSKLISGTDAKTKCALCRLSPDNAGRNMEHYWRPTEYAKSLHRDKHPDLLKERAQRKKDKFLANLTAKRNRNVKRRKISRLASQAEKSTEKSIIQSTKNSGRVNKDGDHILLNQITLDTKLQTTKINPTIFLYELEKVCEDSKRAGTYSGGLVIRNKNGIGCVVMKEADFTRLVKDIVERKD